MSQPLKRRLETLERNRPKRIEEEPIDLGAFNPEERQILEKAQLIIERLNRMKHPGSRFGTENSTEEDRQILVAAARLVHSYQERKRLGGESKT